MAPKKDPSPQTTRHDPTPQDHRGALEAELARVHAELDHLRATMYGEIDVDPEEGDVEVSERTKNISLIAMLELRERTLKDALDSVEKGTYGICNRCQEPISAERLAILPDTKYCVKCQDEIERANMRML